MTMREEEIRRTKVVEYYEKQLTKIGWIVFALFIALDMIATFVYKLRLNIPGMGIYIACSSVFHLWKGYYLDKKSTRRWAMVGLAFTIVQITLWILTWGT